MVSAFGLQIQEFLPPDCYDGYEEVMKAVGSLVAHQAPLEWLQRLSRQAMKRLLQCRRETLRKLGPDVDDRPWCQGFLYMLMLLLSVV